MGYMTMTSLIDMREIIFICIYMTSKIDIREISFICILFTYAPDSLFIILHYYREDHL
jgi:hypothetical protein